MHKLLLFSDPHLVGSDAQDAAFSGLSSCLAHATAHHPDAEHAVFCGDLSDDGLEAGYQALKSACSELSMPVTYLMGNEDNRANFAAVFPKVTPDPNGFYQSSLSFGPHQILCLDTLDPVPDPKHSGILCDDRLSWLNTELEIHQGQKITVVMHHPPMPLGMPVMDGIGLRNGPETCAILKQKGVRHIITGHVHRNSVTEADGLVCTTLGSTAFGIELSTSAAPLTLEANHTPSYSVLLLTDERATLHTQLVPR